MNGLKLLIEDDELLIKGSKEDLLELTNYIKEVASSNLENDHIHLDELTLINDNSNIKNLTIEKEEGNE
jgi:hypothetical protein